MVLLDRLIRADDDSGNAYLRSRGAQSPEKVENKFIPSGIVYTLPDGLTEAQVNLIICAAGGIRALPATVLIDGSGHRAYISHESMLELNHRAIREGVAL